MQAFKLAWIMKSKSNEEITEFEWIIATASLL